MKKKLCLILSLVLVLTVLMTGCSGKDEPTQTNEGVEESKEEVKNPAKERDGAEDTLIVGMTEAKGDFLPGYSSSTYDGYIVDLVFDSLLSNDQEGNPIPNVAKEWELSEDKKTYNLHLRDDVKFSDGEPLTAEDVKFTYTFLSDPNYDGPRASYVRDIEGYKEYHDGDAKELSGIKVIDDYTVSITFTEALSTNIWNISFQVMPEHIYGFEKGNIDEVKAKMTDPVGSGPYIMKHFEPKQYVEFEANENYFLGVPKISKLILKFTTAETMMSELEKGTIDVQLEVPPRNENKEIINNAGFLDIVEFPSNGYGYMGFNLRDPRLSDKKVRQALTYGFNRKQFAEVYFQGGAGVCNVPVSQVSWAYTTDINEYEYNPEKAMELLEEAGWKVGEDGIREKDGIKLDFSWDTYVDSNYVKALIPMLKEDWKKIGVNVEANLMEFNALTEKTFDKRDFEMYNMAWDMSIDPDSYELFHSDEDVPGGFNCMGFRNERNDELLEKGRKEFDQEKRKEIYKEWCKVMNEELPYMFMDQSLNWDVVNKRVKNFNTSPYQKFNYSDILLNIELEK